MSLPGEEGWGGGPWGETPWGSGEPDLELLSALAVRENAVRLEFSTAPEFDGLLTPHDASSPARYSIVAVSGVSLAGEPVRPVLPIFVEVAAVAGADGRFLDVWVDRPFTGYPAVYSVAANNLVAAGGGALLTPGASATFYGARAGAPPPTPDQQVASRDFLVAESARDVVDSGVPGDPSKKLGRLVADAKGDYASATPLAAYRTRVIRRATAALGSFAHLSKSYGSTLKASVKLPGRRAEQEVVAAQIEAQVRLEPETASVTVSVTQADTGVTRFRVVALCRFGAVDVTVG